MSPVLLKLPSGDKQATEDCGRCSHDKGGRLGGSDFPGQHPSQTSRLLVFDTRVLTGQESRRRSDTRVLIRGSEVVVTSPLQRDSTQLYELWQMFAQFVGP